MTRRNDWLVSRLPMGMRDDVVLTRLVALLQEVSDTVLEQVDQLPMLADSAVTPTPMLPWLAGCVNAEDMEMLPEPERRRAIRDAGRLVLRRGTREQLRTLLAPFVVEPFDVVDDGGVFRIGEAPRALGAVRVRVGGLRDTTIEDLRRLAAAAVPAHCVVDIEMVDAPTNEVIA